MLAMLELIGLGLVAEVLIAWIIGTALVTGISPDVIGFRRAEYPKLFWLSVGLLVVLGTGFAAVVIHGCS